MITISFQSTLLLILITIVCLIFTGILVHWHVTTAMNRFDASIKRLRAGSSELELVLRIVSLQLDALRESTVKVDNIIADRQQMPDQLTRSELLFAVRDAICNELKRKEITPKTHSLLGEPYDLV